MANVSNERSTKTYLTISLLISTYIFSFPFYNTDILLYLKKIEDIFTHVAIRALVVCSAKVCMLPLHPQGYLGMLIIVVVHSYHSCIVLLVASLLWKLHDAFWYHEM